MWHSALRYPLIFLTGFLALFGAGRIARHDLHDVFFRTLTEYQARNTVHVVTEIQDVSSRFLQVASPFPVSMVCPYLRTIPAAITASLALFTGFSLDVQPSAAP